MKKALLGLITLILIIASFTLTACVDDNKGTYYPSNEEMKANLEKKGYVVVLYQDLSDNDGNRHNGTLLFASKSREGAEDEYLYFYRLDNSDSCEYYYRAMEQNCENYNSLVKIENDTKFGNIVYCGTTNAINAAGIKTVKVDVDVKL